MIWTSVSLYGVAPILIVVLRYSVPLLTIEPHNILQVFTSQGFELPHSFKHSDIIGDTHVVIRLYLSLPMSISIMANV